MPSRTSTPAPSCPQPQFSDVDSDLQKYSYRLDRYGYARRTVPRYPARPITISAHREVAARMFGADAIDGRIIDHINQNKLDNRRENLRIVTASVNATNRAAPRSNTSGIKGISWHKSVQRWRWMFKLGGKIFQGTCKTIEEAEQQLTQAKREQGYVEFQLSNAPQRKPRAKFTSDPARQRRLFDGLDCLPGQQDLF